jgi:hypothetical protein
MMVHTKRIQWQSVTKSSPNLPNCWLLKTLWWSTRKVPTACFNVHTRVLTLPLWEKASGLVYDLLVGHEVGHALFSPDEDWSETVKVPHQFVNVVEDARIEKLMKRKYAGLAKTFFNGYKELNEEDFFQIADEEVEFFNLADRVNLTIRLVTLSLLISNLKNRKS